MGYRTIREDYVEVIGTIWMPAVTAAYRYPVSGYDAEQIGAVTRENVEQWLTTHAGDFQHVKDFHASIGHDDVPWADEESECTYNDCMYGEGE
jgi:hypothetical protein